MEKVGQQQHFGSDRKENLCLCVSKVAHGERLWVEGTIVPKTKSFDAMDTLAEGRADGLERLASRARHARDQRDYELLRMS
jgi:hypothetical protein